MNIDHLTIGELKQINQLIGQQSNQHPYKIGANYLIRTVTMIQTGRLVEVTPQELVIEDASWIADTGRFSECFSGKFSEVEPFPKGRVIVGRGAVVDATELLCKLPREVK